MSTNGSDNREYDPVANAALGAIRATNRTVREVQRRSGAPELPSQTNVYRGARNGIKGVSQFSPFNVFARGGLPGSSEAASNIKDALPDGVMPEGGPPSPQKVLPDGVPFYDPLGLFDKPGNGNGNKEREKSRGGNGGNGGGSNGGNAESSRASREREVSRT